MSLTTTGKETAMSTAPILAWFGDPELKTEVVQRMRAHREADEIVQGLYQLIDPRLASGYKGCAVGCILPAQPVPAQPVPEHGVHPAAPAGGWHGRVQELYGIPRTVAHLLDRIFEGLPTDRKAHAHFVVAVIEAIPVGADLSQVASGFMLEVLADPRFGVLRHTEQGSAQRAAVQAVIGLYTRRLAADEPTRDEWNRARRDAADAAAAAAADAAAYAADAAAAAAAADAYAAYAADAADAADGANARKDWWTWAAQRLLHHLTHAPIPVAAVA